MAGARGSAVAARNWFLRQAHGVKTARM
jgi:hypothetical protein